LRPEGRAAGVMLAALLGLAAPACSGLFRSRPDIVLIVVDTMRRDHLPCYGYEKPTAPFLASLAAKGVVFENAYSTSAWTAPATASLFTGLYPLQHGVVLGRFAVRQLQSAGVPMRLNRIPGQATTIPEALREGGYATHAVVQNSNVRPELGFDQGFDSFHPLNPSQRADTITEKLMQLREKILSRRPYFLYLHYMDPHRPYVKNPPFFDPQTRGDTRSVSAYDSEIHHVDEHIGRVFEAFGWSRNTLVVVTADHGEELGERGHWGHARTLFAETLNVPLLVFGPGVPAGRRIRDAVSHVDVKPTLRSVAGAPATSPRAGLDLWPLLRGEQDALPERVLFADYWKPQSGEPEPQVKAAIRGRFKRVDGPGGPFLFDLWQDPWELRNRIGLRSQEAEELRQALQRFETTAPRLKREYLETVQDQQMNEELRALGYVN
jgi:arylsulfatase A-like enzyme